MTTSSTFEIVMGVLLLSLWAILPLAFGAMMAFAFRRGIEFVSEPSQRATPTEPWSMFLPRLVRRMRWIGGAFAASVLLTCTGPVWSSQENTWANYALSAMLASLPVSYVLFHGALLWVIAPRTRSPLALALLCCGGSLVAMMLAGIGVGLLPREWRYVDLLAEWMAVSANQTGRPRSGLAGFSTAPAYILALAVVAAAASYLRARRLGGAWFRFPE